MLILNPEHLQSVGLETVSTGQIVAPDQNGATFLSRLQVEALNSLLAEE
jgi:hypothetical protein